MKIFQYKALLPVIVYMSALPYENSHNLRLAVSVPYVRSLTPAQPPNSLNQPHHYQFRVSGGHISHDLSCQAFSFF